MAGQRMGAVYRQVDRLLRNGTVTGLSDRELIERFREGTDRSETVGRRFYARQVTMPGGKDSSPLCFPVVSNN